MNKNIAEKSKTERKWWLQSDTTEGRSQAQKTIRKACYHVGAHKPTVMNISLLNNVAEMLLKTVI